MNCKIFAFAVLLLLMGPTFVHCQTGRGATDTGAMLVSGLFSFSSQGGDLYDGFRDDRVTTIAIVPSLFYFIAPGLGIGGDLSLNRASQGDFSTTTFGIGPKAGYFFDSGTNMIPFVGAGVNYLSLDFGNDNQGGLRFKFAGGVFIRKGHLAVGIEVGYLYDRFKPEGFSESITGNTILIGAGFGGFLY
ncbi:MAG: hypothetical protein ACE5HO_13630 [bacterium]